MLLLWVSLVLHETINVIDGHDVRDEIFSYDLVALSELQNVDKTYIHIAMIMCESNKNDSQQVTSKMSQNLEAMLNSIFKYSKNQNKHWFDFEFISVLK